MSFVFVLDTNKQPQDPVHPAHARRLLTEGKAAVWRRFPFTIILKSPGQQSAPLRLKLDPGSKTTGIALVNDQTGRVVWAANLVHRGQQIRDALLSRKGVRRAVDSATHAIAPHGSSTAHGPQAGLRRRWQVAWRIARHG